MPEYAGITSNIDFQYATSVILGEVYVVSFVTAIKLAIDWIKQKEYLNETNEFTFVRRCRGICTVAGGSRCGAGLPAW